MTLKASEIEHLAALARLELTKGKQEKFPQEISGILDYVKSLQEVKGYELDEGLKAPASLLRTDQVLAWPATEQLAFISAAPDTENGLIKTKPVFDR